MAIETYKGNPNLKSAQVRQEYTQEQVTEFIKCSQDPVYFIESYVNIVSIDEGLVPFKMYPFQSEIVETFHGNRFTICKLPRQSGKSTVVLSYLIHWHLLLVQVLFVVVLTISYSLMSSPLSPATSQSNSFHQFIQQSVQDNHQR